MADAARTYIDSVMVQLAQNREQAIPHKVGGRTWHQHDAPPYIKWRYGSIVHEPATEQGSIGNEVQTLEIAVWDTDNGDGEDRGEENTRQLKNDLLLAARQIATQTTTQPLQVGDWDWNEDANMKHGRRLEGSIDVTFPVPGEAIATVVILTTKSTGKSTNPHTQVEEVVC